MKRNHITYKGTLYVIGEETIEVEPPVQSPNFPFERIPPKSEADSGILVDDETQTLRADMSNRPR